MFHRVWKFRNKAYFGLQRPMCPKNALINFINDSNILDFYINQNMLDVRVRYIKWFFINK